MLNRLLSDPIFPLFIAALVAPFLLWATIAMVARRRPEILPRLYPAIRVLAWGLWVCAIAWYLYFLYPKTANSYRVGFIFVPLSGGTNLVYQWMRRRVDPASYQKHEDWWPTPKDKAL